MPFQQSLETRIIITQATAAVIIWPQRKPCTIHSQRHMARHACRILRVKEQLKTVWQFTRGHPTSRRASKIGSFRSQAEPGLGHIDDCSGVYSQPIFQPIVGCLPFRPLIQMSMNAIIVLMWALGLYSLYRSYHVSRWASSLVY